jgi:hypothetical protein
LAGVGAFTGAPLSSAIAFFGALSAAKVSFGFSAMAARMNSDQMGSAARAPVSFSPSDWRLSYPIQVPQVTDGEKPMNQASV